MLRSRFAFLAIIAIFVAGLLLVPSSPAGNQAVHAQGPDSIPTELVPNNWPLIPGGLGPGDTFRLLFITTAKTTGTSSGGIHYNSHVVTEAEKNPEFKEWMSQNFTALVSVYQGLDARGNTLTRHLDSGYTSPIYWVKGAKVADNYADFYDGDWDSRDLRDHMGASSPHNAPHQGTVMTGSKSDGTHATTDTGWSVAVGSPRAPWSFGQRHVAFGNATSSGAEIYLSWGDVGDVSYPIYAISPLFKVRDTTGPRPVITGPAGEVRGPFDVTISFPGDDQIKGIALSDVTVVGGTVSNLRGHGATYTFTITPDYAESIYDPTTVSVSMQAGAVSDMNNWQSVASDTFTVKSIHLRKTAVNIAFDDSGVGTVPKSWALIPSADIKPGDTFRLLFVTSDARNGQSRNIGDYNSFVQNAAARNALLQSFSGRFRALASVHRVHAIDNSGTRGNGVPIYWLEGARVANSYPDFYDGSWASKAGTDEQGNRLSSQTDIWTGTKNDGTEHASELGSPFFYAQYSSLGIASPFGASGTETSYRKHFYALSPLLRVAGGTPTPTP